MSLEELLKIGFFGFIMVMGIMYLTLLSITNHHIIYEKVIFKRQNESIIPCINCKEANLTFPNGSRYEVYILGPDMLYNVEKERVKNVEVKVHRFGGYPVKILENGS